MLYAFDFQYAGFLIDAAQDEQGQIWISTPTIEKLVLIRSDSTRKAFASESFKSFAGKDYALGKLRSKSTKYNTFYKFFVFRN